MATPRHTNGHFRKSTTQDFTAETNEMRQNMTEKEHPSELSASFLMKVYEFPLVRSHTSRCRTGYRREPGEYLQVGDEVDDSLARPFVLRNLQGINDARSLYAIVMAEMLFSILLPSAFGKLIMFGRFQRCGVPEILLASAMFSSCSKGCG